MAAVPFQIEPFLKTFEGFVEEICTSVLRSSVDRTQDIYEKLRPSILAIQSYIDCMPSHDLSPVIQKSWRKFTAGWETDKENLRSPLANGTESLYLTALLVEAYAVTQGKTMVPFSTFAPRSMVPALTYCGNLPRPPSPQFPQRLQRLEEMAQHSRHQLERLRAELSRVSFTVRPDASDPTAGAAAAAAPTVPTSLRGREMPPSFRNYLEEGEARDMRKALRLSLGLSEVAPLDEEPGLFEALVASSGEAVPAPVAQAPTPVAYGPVECAPVVPAPIELARPAVCVPPAFLVRPPRPPADGPV